MVRQMQILLDDGTQRKTKQQKGLCLGGVVRSYKKKRTSPMGSFVQGVTLGLTSGGHSQSLSGLQPLHDTPKAWRVTVRIPQQAIVHCGSPMDHYRGGSPVYLHCHPVAQTLYYRHRHPGTGWVVRQVAASIASSPPRPRGLSAVQWISDMLRGLSPMR